MTKSVHILILEDNPVDAELVQYELKEAGFAFTAKVVMTEKDFVHELQEDCPDLILSDYDLPQYNGALALAETRRRCPEIPFILVTGAVGEDRAIEILTQGAKDYVLKSRLQRLAPAVRRALAEAEEHRARKAVEEELLESHRILESAVEERSAALRESVNRYRSLFENMLNGFAYCRMLFDQERPQDFIYLDVNSAFESLTGLKNVVGKKVSEVIPGIRESDPELFEIYGRVALTGKPEKLEKYVAAVNMWLSISVFSPEKEHFVAIFDVITERKLLEETQSFLLQSGYQDEDFFASLARYLAQSLGMDYVCIDQLRGDRLTAQTVAIYFDGKFEDNVEYTLKDTPCGDVVGKTICCFPREVRHLFPQDAILQEMVAESYVGTTLWSSKGQPIGLIAVLSRKPLVDPRLAEAILKLVGVRAAGELERKRAEEAIQERTSQLEAANKELESFSYSISHDLRAPLRAMNGFSRMLARDLKDKLDEESMHRLDTIRKNGMKMNQLIDDVLTFSRLIQESLTMTVICMEDLATDVWNELQENNPQRNISINVAHPMACYGDYKMIRRVLTNLLSNAAKFTKERQTATIGIGSYEKEHEYVYYVKDNGSGFDMQSADKLFGLFQRLHSDAEYEGTGAGLSIVKRIVERHRGRVWAEGKVDEGATFYFTLPKQLPASISPSPIVGIPT